ncbi:hypothetical protein HCN44_001858 [Aphidius gifuensis]|uniref:Uncharacterized protein n=1 Tax=Aphidius gifuensis TaxID=684658 RepID=A0A834Y493_APHGI|nr:centromere-associated protein E [Aphidius gifuensis]KAF7996226.1 hypothetical protein HCN44_001858 [Aphidius gifuensis]
MAIKLWIITIFLLQIFDLNIQQIESREITHEDIKDAMLSLVHMMRENTEKLERHEVRERQLGEQLKKALSLLGKKVSTIDGFKTNLNKLEEKISGVEQLISQKDERERIQIQKTSNTVDLLSSRLEGWFNDMDRKLNEIKTKESTTTTTVAPPVVDYSSDIILKLNETESSLGSQISHLEIGLDVITKKLKESNNNETEKINLVSTEMKTIGSKIVDIEASLEVLKKNTQIIHDNINKPSDSPNLAIEEQTRALERLKNIVEDTSDRIQKIPLISEVKALHNETKTALNEAKHALEDVIIEKTNVLDNKAKENREESQDSIRQLRLDLANNAERVNQELRDLEKGQSVMVSMADHVLDTKKRVEYGVHQILLEVGDLVKTQGININDTLSTRFDGISNDIMDNQNGAVANLTSKMEQEMNQIWRQINVMYQQMTESARALEKLHKQNEVYVNGTTTTMGGMENKVGEITKRMAEVDENLNYLLGRLSLVTHEFNEIKSGLGTALDNIKESFKEVQEKANDFKKPGPHPVPDNYKELDLPKSNEIINHT